MKHETILARVLSISVALVFLMIALPGLCATSSVGQKTTDAMQALERFKNLEGTWSGTGPDGEPAQVIYEVVAGGTAVVETFAPESDHAMVTVYHLDGDRLMLTHYCVAGNQPRMEATKISSGSIHFEHFDGTSMVSEQDGHMHSAVFDLNGTDQYSSVWTWRENGEEQRYGQESFRRVPAGSEL